MVRWMILLLAMAVAGPAGAGAWPRGQGHAFFDLSADSGRQKLYAEIGLAHDFTVGVEVTHPRGRRLPDVLNFIRHPIHRFANGAVLSGSLAFDLRETYAAARRPDLRGVEETAVRAGLLFGKGFESGLGSGWMEVDAEVERVVTTDWLGQPFAYKLDATLGVKPTERLIVFVQAQTYRRDPDAMSLRLEPAVAFGIGRTHLVVSPSVAVTGARDPRVKVGLWVEF